MKEADACVNAHRHACVHAHTPIRTHYGNPGKQGPISAEQKCSGTLERQKDSKARLKGNHSIKHTQERTAAEVRSILEALSLEMADVGNRGLLKVWGYSKIVVEASQ